MTILGDMIQQKMNNRAARGRQEQLQQLVGMPEQFPQGPGGQVPGPPTQATGIQAVPVQDQRQAFAAGLMQIPSLQGAGISMFDSALQQRAQLFESAQQQTQALLQNQDQFDVTHGLARDKWAFNQSLQVAQHAMKLRDSEQDFYLGEQQKRQSELSMIGMQQAQSEVERKKRMIPEPLRAEVTNLLDGQAIIAEQLSSFDDEFAFNAPLVMVGKAQLELLRKKDNKSPAEMSKLAFWEGERELMLRLRKDLFGATTTEQDDKLLAELSVNESDNSKDVRRKLIRSLTLIQDKLKRRSSEISQMTGGVRDLSQDFIGVDVDQLTRQLNAPRARPGTLQADPTKVRPRDDSGLVRL